MPRAAKGNILVSPTGGINSSTLVAKIDHELGPDWRESSAGDILTIIDSTIGTDWRMGNGTEIVTAIDVALGTGWRQPMTATTILASIDAEIGTDWRIGTGLEIISAIESELGSDWKSGSASVLTVAQVAHGFTVGEAIRCSAGTYVKSQADTDAHSDVIAIVSKIVDENTFEATTSGLLKSVDYIPGSNYYLDVATAGNVTNLEPVYVEGNVRVYIGTGTPDGLLVNIDVGSVVAEQVPGIKDVIQLVNMTIDDAVGGLGVDIGMLQGRMSFNDSSPSAYVSDVVTLPYDWDNTTDLTVVLSSAISDSTPTSNAVFNVGVELIQDGVEVLAQADTVVSTTEVTPIEGTNVNQRITLSIPKNNMTQGDQIIVRVHRDTDNVLDVGTSTITALNAHIEYTTNNI